MIFINKEDIQSVDQGIIQDSIRDAYKMMLTNEYNMPDRIHVTDEKNVLLLMPCFSKQFFVTKLVSVFPDAHRFDKPSVNGVLVLNDNRTGEPLAFMDGAAVTAQRTGAVGGLAVDILTGKTIKSAGVMGAGVQGFQQARYLLFNRKVEQLNLFDLDPDAARRMGDRLSDEFEGVACRVSDSPEQLVDDSNVVVAATTSHQPLFDLPSPKIKGKLFISIGSFRPDMQEFPNAVIETADSVFVDTLFACKESGDIAIPLDLGRVNENKILEFAGLLKEPMPLNDKTILFKSVGMALFDLAAAIAIYGLSKTMKLGTKLNF